MVFNIERRPTKMDVEVCEHKKDWKEEWLLDSGSTVNLTNKKECWWTHFTVTVGVGSQVKGQMDGNIILKGKKWERT
jgi:hypothetical protein